MAKSKQTRTPSLSQEGDNSPVEVKEPLMTPPEVSPDPIPEGLGIKTVKYMKVTAIDGENVSFELVDEEKPQIVRKADYVFNNLG